MNKEIGEVLPSSTLRERIRGIGKFATGIAAGYLLARFLAKPPTSMTQVLPREGVEPLHESAPIALEEMVRVHADAFDINMFVDTTTLSDEEKIRAQGLLKSMTTAREKFLILNAYLPEIKSVTLGVYEAGGSSADMDELSKLLSTQNFQTTTAEMPSIIHTVNEEDCRQGVLGFRTRRLFEIVSQASGEPLPEGVSSIDVFQRDIFEIHEVDKILRNTPGAQVFHETRRLKTETRLDDPNDTSVVPRYSIVYAIVRRNETKS